MLWTCWTVPTWNVTPLPNIGCGWGCTSWMKYHFYTLCLVVFCYVPASSFLYTGKYFYHNSTYSASTNRFVTGLVTLNCWYCQQWFIIIVEKQFLRFSTMVYWNSIIMDKQLAGIQLLMLSTMVHYYNRKTFSNIVSTCILTQYYVRRNHWLWCTRKVPYIPKKHKNF
jgi:hypothetical protein